METIFTVTHLLISVALIAFILLQHGKGADAGAAFGSGASATVFGARGAASFLSRTSAILAAAFFLNSLVLAYFASQTELPEGLMEGVTAAIGVEKEASPPATQRVETESEVPVVPAISAVPLSDESAVPEVSTPSEPAVVPKPEAAEKPAAPQ